MRLPFALLLVLALPASAAEGFYVELDGGGASWDWDQPGLQAQLESKVPGNMQCSDFRLVSFGECRAQEFATQLEGGPSAQLRMGYNILGHASVEAFIVGSGWDIGVPSVGGGGLAGVAAAWHPLQIWLPERQFDVGLGLGGGYGIVGETRAMDGGAMVLTFAGEWSPVPFFAVTAGLRRMIPFFSRYVVDWDDRDLPGGSVELDESASGGATFFYLGVKFLFTPRR